MTAQQVLAALAFVVCVALLVHMVLGERRQARLAWWWQGRVAAMQRAWRRWRAPRRRGQPGQPSRPTRSASAPAARGPARDDADAGPASDPTSDSARGDAEREAADLIERARRGANGSDKGSGNSGNVIRPPHGFGGDRSKGPRRDLH